MSGATFNWLILFILIKSNKVFRGSRDFKDDKGTKLKAQTFRLLSYPALEGFNWTT